METVRIVKMLLLILLLTACAPTVKNPTPLPMTSQTQTVITTDYLIQAGDQLEVKFFYNPELNELVIVRPDGRISLQLANEVLVAGQTPSQVTEQLRKKYSKDIEKPEITVFVRSANSQRVFVDGEVNKPGLIPLAPPMSVLQSISQAGGLKDSARASDIIVVRRSAENKLITMEVDLTKAIDNSDMSQDILLMANDIVYIPRSAIANLNLWVDQYIRKNIPVPFTIPIY